MVAFAQWRPVSGTACSALLPRLLRHDARELIERKKAGERTVLDAATAEHWLKRVDGAFEALKQAEDGSELPEDAGNAAELDRWLVDVRMRVAGRALRVEAAFRPTDSAFLPQQPCGPGCSTANSGPSSCDQHSRLPRQRTRRTHGAWQ
jgi:hypothetical protein